MMLIVVAIWSESGALPKPPCRAGGASVQVLEYAGNWDQVVGALFHWATSCEPSHGGHDRATWLPSFSGYACAKVRLASAVDGFYLARRFGRSSGFLKELILKKKGSLIEFLKRQPFTPRKCRVKVWTEHLLSTPQVCQAQPVASSSPSPKIPSLFFPRLSAR